MAILTYRGITLNILETKDILREAIYTEDGVTFLYQKWTIDVQCVYNPAATSYRPGPVNLQVDAPVALTGRRPPETDAAIRNLLLQPRGDLLYQDDDGRTILKTPDTNMETDAKNGPTPRVCEVVRIHGTKTWMVRFRIETYINECRGSGNGHEPLTLNPLLAHRWRRYQDVDQDHFSQIITQGEAIFRTDQLFRLGFYPDAYRNDLLHAVPNNCQRESIHVEENSDGTGVKYTIVDTERAFNIGNANCTRIEAYQTHWHRIKEPAAAALEQFGKGNGLVAAGFAALAAAIPRFYFHFNVKVWGNRNHLRRDLMNIGIALLLHRIGNVGLTLSSEFIITHEITGKFVEVQGTHTTGPTWAVANVLNPNRFLDGTGTIGFNAANDNNNVPLAFGGANLEITSVPIGNPQPARNRGTLLCEIVHAALSYPCAQVPYVVNVNSATIDRTR